MRAGGFLGVVIIKFIFPPLFLEFRGFFDGGVLSLSCIKILPFDESGDSKWCEGTLCFWVFEEAEEILDVVVFGMAPDAKAGA